MTKFDWEHWIGNDVREYRKHTKTMETDYLVLFGPEFKGKTWGRVTITSVKQLKDFCLGLGQKYGTTEVLCDFERDTIYVGVMKWWYQRGENVEND